MNNKTWNLWTLAAIGMALVLATASIVGIVVVGGHGAVTFPAVSVQPTPPPVLIAQAVPTTTWVIIAECLRFATSETSPRGKTIDAANDTQRNRAYRTAYSSCMSARGYN